MNSSQASTKVGIVLSRKWSVGPELGCGACGSVHAAIPTSSSKSSSSSNGVSYVVKLAPVPPPTSSVKSGKKRRERTPAQRNADLVFHEYTAYRNMFALQGTVIPKLSYPGDGGPPAYGEKSGYRFLCMERMHCSLSEVIPLLISEAEASSWKSSDGIKINLGPIAQILIKHMRSIHQRELLFVDVKVENFMLANEGGRKKRGGGSMAAELASRIRLIDLGLVESLKDIMSGKVRKDLHPNAPVVGTPEFASINVLAGHTVYCSDDLIALGLVISSLILRAVQWGDDAQPNEGGQFPWSNAQSDEEVLTIKTTELVGSFKTDDGFKWFPGFSGGGGGSSSGNGNGNGKGFYESMAAGGNEDVERAMRKYFDTLLAVEYSEKVDYEKLIEITADLTVRVSSGGSDSSEGSSEDASSESGSVLRSLENDSVGSFEGNDDGPELGSEEDTNKGIRLWSSLGGLAATLVGFPIFLVAVTGILSTAIFGGLVAWAFMGRGTLATADGDEDSDVEIIDGDLDVQDTELASSTGGGRRARNAGE